MSTSTDTAHAVVRNAVGAVNAPTAPPLTAAPSPPATGELTARTRAGAELVSRVESLRPLLATGVAERDAARAFPLESLRALTDAGVLAASLERSLGGLGVSSLHDLAVVASRLARTDPSLAIGLNMHLVFHHNVALRRRQALRTGSAHRAEAFGALLRSLASQRAVLAAAISEPGQDVTRPSTRARRIPVGWEISGRKIFCTMASAATILYTAVSFTDDAGVERYGFALVPARAPRVTIHGDWDGLGLRSSASDTVTLDAVAVPASALTGGFRAGDVVAYMERNLAAGVLHAAASLGIAEAAHELAAGALRRRAVAAGRDRTLLAESEVDLAAGRALLARAADMLDEHEDVAAGGGERAQVVRLFAEAQAAKTFLNAAAERVADRSLAIGGGAAFLATHPLARLYRDARAGAFMHPLGANRAYDLLAQVALGEEVNAA